MRSQTGGEQQNTMIQFHGESEKPPLLRPITKTWERRDMAIQIHVKDGIQPFEEKLALMEISSLSGKKIDQLPKNRIIETTSRRKNFVQLCLSKLVFSDYIVNEKSEKIPTIQHQREVGENGKYNRKRNLRFGVHDLHEYKAKFWPQFVRSAINIECPISANCLVLDPMMGSGTTAVEALSLNHRVVGFDINPLSCLITEAKIALNSMNRNGMNNLFQELKKLDIPISINLEEVYETKVLKYLRLWFNEEDLEDLVALRYQIEALPVKTRTVGLAILSDIINPISYQKESEQRPKKDKRDYIVGETLRLFNSKIEKMSERMESTTLPQNFTPDSEIHNVTYLESSRVIDDSSVDIIVTSPPYFTAMPYLIADRLNLFVLGMGAKSEVMKEKGMIGSREVTSKEASKLWSEYQKNKQILPDSVQDLIELTSANFHGGKEGIGQRRKVQPELLYRYFRDMRGAILLNYSQLKEGGVMWMLVGNNFTKKNNDEKIIINTPSLLCDIAIDAGFEVKEIIDTEIPQSREIYSSNQGSSEVILVLKKNQGIGVNNKTEFTTDWDFHEGDATNPLHSIHTSPKKSNSRTFSTRRHRFGSFLRFRDYFARSEITWKKFDWC